MADRGWRAFALAWHALAALFVAFGLSQVVPDTPLRQASPARLQLLWVVACYAAVAAAITVMHARGRRPLVWAVPVAVAGFGVLALALVLANLPPSRLLLAGGLAATIVLAPIPLVAGRGRALLLAALILAVAGLTVRGLRGPGPSIHRSVVVTALSDLDVVTYRGWLPAPRATGGAIVPLGEGFLVVDADGRFAHLTWPGQGDSLAVTPLSLRAPLNADQFIADVPQLDRTRVRVADLLVQETSEGIRVFLSHIFWHHDRRCWVVRLSGTVLPSDLIPAAAAGPGEWRTVFESQPCLPIDSGDPEFNGHMMGGAMALTDSTHLLLALGDFEIAGVNAAIAQDSAADYGKTLIIDVESGRGEHYTLGHRNPQGLVVDSSGTIWLTEHGPMGGDELNRIERESNYGWPRVTLGMQYDGGPWPPHRATVGDPVFRLPVYGWVPSVAPTGAIQIRHNSVPAWRGDLLVASLRHRSLWRVRIRDDRAIYVESICIGMRIRDLAEAPGGRIVLWTDDGVLVSIRPSRGVKRSAK